MEKQDEEKKSSEGKKSKGWFSRRHQTAEAHQAAVGKYLAEHGRTARKQGADERNAYRASLSPAQQLIELDRRLGNGVGAVKERARLSALVAK